jgi:hypothetical protein
LKPFLRALILASLVLQSSGLPLVPPPVLAAPAQSTSAAASFGARAFLGELVSSIRAILPLGNVQASGAPPPTHDDSPSTPWTAFSGDVNVASGNLALQQTDLSIPSTGLATTSTRTYNSSASGYHGRFGSGWFWNYEMQVLSQTGSATVVREDGRPTHTL